MTAHIVYPTFDPMLPATLSPAIIQRVIRRRIGFQGVLVTDDLAMKALVGTPEDLAGFDGGGLRSRAFLQVGGNAPTEALLSRCPPVSEQARERLAQARAKAARARLDLDAEALARERDRSLT